MATGGDAANAAAMASMPWARMLGVDMKYASVCQSWLPVGNPGSAVKPSAARSWLTAESAAISVSWGGLAPIHFSRARVVTPGTGDAEDGPVVVRRVRCSACATAMTTQTVAIRMAMRTMAIARKLRLRRRVAVDGAGGRAIGRLGLGSASTNGAGRTPAGRGAGGLGLPVVGCMLPGGRAGR